jgi:hypothetical protein
VCAQSVLSLECREVVYDDTTVGTAGDEDVGDGVELELTDEGRVSLKEHQEFTEAAKR